MARKYHGLVPHIPGTAIMEGGMGTGLNELQSPLFTKWFGSEIIAMPNAGLTHHPRLGYSVARPIVVLSDLLQFNPGSPGTGLVSETPGSNQELPWVTSVREHLFPAIEAKGLLTLLPGDQHLNPQFLDRGALSRFKLDRKQLSKAQLAIIDGDPVLRRKAATGETITVGEYEQVFGAVADKEDFNFIPHCWQELVQPIPSQRSLLERHARKITDEQRRMGYPRPVANIIPDFKTGLSPDSAPDEWGLNANVIIRFLRYAYDGIYTDGPSHRGFKVAYVGGIAWEYSMEMLVQLLVDQNFFVVAGLAHSGTMGVDDLYGVMYKLTSRYSRKFFPTWDWPFPAHFGPEPAGFKRLAATAKAMAYEQSFGPANAPLHGIVKQLGKQMSGSVSMEMARLVNMYNERRFDDEDLFWSMAKIEANLENGG